VNREAERCSQEYHPPNPKTSAASDSVDHESGRPSPQSLPSKDAPDETVQDEAPFELIVLYDRPNIQMLQKCPIIVWIVNQNRWVRLECNLCKSNVTPRGKWFRGMSALLRHLKSEHIGSSRPSTETSVLENCVIDELSDEDVESIVRNPRRIPRLLNGRNLNSVDEMGATPLAREGTACSGHGVNVETATSRSKQHTTRGLRRNQGELSPAIPSPSNIADIPKRFPTLVKNKKGEWAELRCMYCGGNFTHSKSAASHFIHGLNGFRSHLIQAHPRVKELLEFRAGRDDWILKHCVHKHWAEDAVMRGVVKIEKRKCRSDDGLPLRVVRAWEKEGSLKRPAANLEAAETQQARRVRVKSPDSVFSQSDPAEYEDGDDDKENQAPVYDWPASMWLL
jgi:hypothetical protein